MIKGVSIIRGASVLALILCLLLLPPTPLHSTHDQTQTFPPLEATVNVLTTQLEANLKGQSNSFKLDWGGISPGDCGSQVRIEAFPSGNANCVVIEPSPSCSGTMTTACGHFHAAEYEITGAPNAAYNIGFPISGSQVCSEPNSLQCLNVSLYSSVSFNTTGTNTGVLDNSGQDKVFVGGTIFLGTNTNSGHYHHEKVLNTSYVPFAPQSP